MAFRKRLENAVPAPSPAPAAAWLALEQLVEVSVSSEDPGHPIEAALGEGDGSGWRAATAGEQSVTLHFDEPRQIGLIHLVVEEAEHERTQEFAIHWSADHGQAWHLVVRQQFTFSPSGATRQMEHYRVSLPGLTDLRLTIRPDLSNGPHVATLARLALQ
jgi:hypothetical protein